MRSSARRSRCSSPAARASTSRGRSSANGVPSLAIVAVAGPEGAELSRLLERDGILCRFVPVSGRTRSNTTVCEPDGTVTKLNEPGSPLSDADLAAIATAVRTSVRDGDWLVVSGSTPPDLSAEQVSALLARGAGDRRAARHRLERRRAGVGTHRASPASSSRTARSSPSSSGRELGSVAAVVEAAEEVRALRRRPRAREPRRRGRRARRAGRHAHGRSRTSRSPAAPSAPATASWRDSCPASPRTRATSRPPSSRR